MYYTLFYKNIKFHQSPYTLLNGHTRFLWNEFACSIFRITIDSAHTNVAPTTWNDSVRLKWGSCLCNASFEKNLIFLFSQCAFVTELENVDPFSRTIYLIFTNSRREKEWWVEKFTNSWKVFHVFQLAGIHERWFFFSRITNHIVFADSWIAI